MQKRNKIAYRIPNKYNRLYTKRQTYMRESPSSRPIKWEELSASQAIVPWPIIQFRANV